MFVSTSSILSGVSHTLKNSVSAEVGPLTLFLLLMVIVIQVERNRLALFGRVREIATRLISDK